MRWGTPGAFVGVYSTVLQTTMLRVWSRAVLRTPRGVPPGRFGAYLLEGEGPSARHQKRHHRPSPSVDADDETETPPRSPTTALRMILGTLPKEDAGMVRRKGGRISPVPGKNGRISPIPDPLPHRLSNPSEVLPTVYATPDVYPVGLPSWAAPVPPRGLPPPPLRGRPHVIVRSEIL
eukprot:Hpha_TRINITY_DN22355_c0_g1::TRINITY_DN22355_c0_g1_i1::g.177804::m.177804